MIPKKIHYIWFGDSSISKLGEDCIESWLKFAPDYEVIKWDEEKYFSNFDDLFVKKMISVKKYAFAADYARCRILHEIGGVYLDVDMELVKELVFFDECEAFIGAESENNLSFGIAGSVKGFWFFDELRKLVKSANGLETIPKLANKIFKDHGGVLEFNDKRFLNGLIVYPAEYFYPFNPYDNSGRKQLLFSYIKPETYAIHHWEKNWKLSTFERLKIKFKKIFN